MPKFFSDHIRGGSLYIDGEDARHIARVLRMTPGREITVCDMQGNDYRCAILSVDAQVVVCDILETIPCRSESRVKLHLYQALPKGDKLAIIVQKAVEMGAVSITPVLTSRCISRSSDTAFERKRQRLQKIAHEAAKQSGRGIVPEVEQMLSFEQAVESMGRHDLRVMLYEESEKPLREVLQSGGEPGSVALMVGSEGGFARQEVDYAAERGVVDASLGTRILRCETAPVCALAALGYHYGEF